ncbi:MAG: hypothetical protein J6Y85_00660 [Alphaproteobacteria bacterium]|nr:hypothetical protein [Alphaproteobacteria bacterium]
MENKKQPLEKNKKTHRQILQEERYVWMARAFVMMTVLGILANVLLLIAISGAVPFLRVQPFYLDIRSRDEQLISIERLAPEQLNDRNLQDYLVRQYIDSYFNVGSDPKEYELRTNLDSFLASRSEESVYRQFQNMRAQILHLMERENFTRKAEVLRTDRPMPPKNGLSTWIVRLRLKDMNQAATEEKVGDYEVVLEVFFDPKRQTSSWSKRLKNPLGFKVRRIGITDLNKNKSSNN